MDNLRRFPAPWTMFEDEHGFSVRDASGFYVCGIPHRQDLHERGYQYAGQFMTREEARRIAKAISRLPDLLRRPPYLRGLAHMHFVQLVTIGVEHCNVPAVISRHVERNKVRVFKSGFCIWEVDAGVVIQSGTVDDGKVKTGHRLALQARRQTRPSTSESSERGTFSL